MRQGILVMGALLFSCGWLGGCGRKQLPEPADTHARYTLGPAWQSGGYWFYPAEEVSYHATGLAIVDPLRRVANDRTADGERYDPASLAAAHQTLQLPVIVRVRNLENGRRILLRVNDRGPASPGRLLSITPHAARLLGMVPGRATRVEVTEDAMLSRGLLLQVEGAPIADIAAAPVSIVQEQSLAPAGDTHMAVGVASSSPEPLAPGLPGPPSEIVETGAADPGRLWIDAGHFSQPVYARRLAAQLAGMVREEGSGRSAVFSVRVGPFNLPDEADAALDQARSAGVTGARIIVE